MAVGSRPLQQAEPGGPKRPQNLYCGESAFPSFVAQLRPNQEGDRRGSPRTLACHAGRGEDCGRGEDGRTVGSGGRDPCRSRALVSQLDQHAQSAYLNLIVTVLQQCHQPICERLQHLSDGDGRFWTTGRIGCQRTNRERVACPIDDTEGLSSFLGRPGQGIAEQPCELPGVFPP